MHVGDPGTRSERERSEARGGIYLCSLTGQGRHWHER